MLTDWAALSSLPAARTAGYQSAWMPGAALPESVPDQDKLACAAPAMLVALAAMLSTTQVRPATNVHYSWYIGKSA